MRGSLCAFNGLVGTPVVRRGADENLKENHTFYVVYSEMFLQICRDYQCLPDVRTIKAGEIRFFYEGLRAELKQHTEG